MGFLDSLFTKFLGKSKMRVADRFELMREAISGTMSNFYVARDRENDYRVIGLKILDVGKTEQIEGRFKLLNKPSEGEISVAMKHPLIVETLEYGFTSKDEPYLIMEFLDGQGLNSMILGKSKLLNGNRLTLIRQAGEALAYVHKQGYIHRDICPRNFVVHKDGKSLKMIDFGLTLPAKPEFMQPGNRTGTPSYMAPEIIRRRKTDQRADIFAFGVMAFEILTLDLPWPRGKATGMDALNHDKIEPIDIRTVAPTINPVLADAVMKCLKVNPDERPQRIEDFLELIKDVKDDGVRT